LAVCAAPLSPPAALSVVVPVVACPGMIFYFLVLAK